MNGLDRESADLIAAAKLWLISPPTPGGRATGDMPYLSAALYALAPVPTEQVAKMATDLAWRLYVNPQWLLDPVPDIAEVGRELAHQIWHLLADHGGRAHDLGVSGATSRAWRAAADVTIHPILESLPREPHTAGPVASRSAAPVGRAGHRAHPGGAGTPAHVMAAREAAFGDQHVVVSATSLGLPPGLSAEEYFAMLSGLPAAGAEPDVDPAWESGGGDQGSGPDPSCGSGCDGLHRRYELPETAEQGGLSAVAGAAIRRTVAISMRDSVGQGSLPGQWQRWVEQVLDPIVDWRNVLHAAVRRGLGWAHGHTDYTYTRISRRQAGAGPVILPALRRPVPRVGIVVDTSGSVDDGLLAQALGEIDGVLGTLGVPDPQVSVLAVDAAVQTVSAIRSARAIPLAGGGGTNMSLGIAAAQELRPRVEVIIVLTDGWTDWPARPTPVPVIAVLIGRERAALPSTPDWIQRVECVR
ncbi:MAG: VWA-like domain-containing protein [Candidatus Nanopelagicales bacterium]